MTNLHFDIETHSVADLRKVGAYKYFEHEHTGVWCAAYAVDDDDVKMWHPDLDDADVKHAIKHADHVYAHNANFERLGFRHVLGPRHGFPVPGDEDFRCTMAMAFAMALPGSLEGAAAALGLPDQKDMAGNRVMKQLARPRRMEGGKPVWWDTPEKFEKLYAYCMKDVEVERGLHERLLPLRPQEQRVYFMDQRINDRGVMIDHKLAGKSLAVVEATIARLNDEMHDVTGGEVSRVTNTGQLNTWLNANGVDCRSLAKDQLDELLALDLPDKCRRALELRKEGAKTSTAKINKMMEMRCADGRMRGNLQYHGANTGRWAARGAQLQNLPRPEAKDVTQVVRAVATGDADWVEMMCGNPMQAVADSVRGHIVAPKGRKIIAADFSQIEARVLPWLAGAEGVLDTFRKDEDIYCKAASGIFGKPINKDDHSNERQVGKVSVLSLGYQGGARAFANMAANYGLKLEPVLDFVWPTATSANRKKAKESWTARGKSSGMTKRAWVAGELTKLAWRDSNPEIVGYWDELDGAAILAVQRPGKQVHVGSVTYLKKGSFLFCRLPSGRAICYPYPVVKETETPWGSFQDTLFYEGVDSYTKKWGVKSFYGGLAAENITQAVARDVMAEAMLRVEDAGYEMTITIHDEVVGEVDAGASLDDFVSIITETPSWAEGLPIAADGFIATRYRK